MPTLRFSVSGRSLVLGEESGSRTGSIIKDLERLLERNPSYAEEIISQPEIKAYLNESHLLIRVLRVLPADLRPKLLEMERPTSAGKFLDLVEYDFELMHVLKIVNTEMAFKLLKSEEDGGLFHLLLKNADDDKLNANLNWLYRKWPRLTQQTVLRKFGFDYALPILNGLDVVKGDAPWLSIAEVVTGIFNKLHRFNFENLTTEGVDSLWAAIDSDFTDIFEGELPAEKAAKLDGLRDLAKVLIVTLFYEVNKATFMPTSKQVARFRTMLEPYQAIPRFAELARELDQTLKSLSVYNPAAASGAAAASSAAVADDDTESEDDAIRSGISSAGLSTAAAEASVKSSDILRAFTAALESGSELIIAPEALAMMEQHSSVPAALHTEPSIASKPHLPMWLVNRLWGEAHDPDGVPAEQEFAQDELDKVYGIVPHTGSRI